ncbi:MAG TPA: 4Fe-4S dicluster domain-containing protein, partial [Candidatus Mailhella excrementigallinarum]|nr:4Fe-4S dicluster domain-containing protein [Candidatus Mailhella excrementigallinarum]
MSRYVMVIDATKCMNCKACLVACQQRNHVPLGHARNWVRQTPDVSSPLGFAFQPGACMHCDKPLCVDACPTHATYKADDGSVVIDKS